MFGPVVHGAKIRLTPPQPEFLEAYVRWFADPVVTQHLQLRNPPSLHQEQEWFSHIAASQNDVVWAIVMNDGDRLIGNTGLHRIDWRHRHAYSGIIIGESLQWGKGFGSEAMRLRTAYAFRELGLEKVLTAVYQNNVASRRALEKAGYRQCGLRRRQRFYNGAWHDEWLGEILREEWEQAQAAQG